jgi:hypothetical protein
MDRSEFKKLKDYIQDLKKEENSTVKGKEFVSLVPLILQAQEGRLLLIRDYLEIDGTFAVIIDCYSKIGFAQALDFYQSVCEIIEQTTYSHIEQEGIIRDFGSYEGFWIKIDT